MSNLGYPLVVAAPVLGLAKYTASHLVLARWRQAASPYPMLILAFVPGLAVTACVTGFGLWLMQASAADVVGLMLLNGVTYFALGWGYFHFVNMGVASLRIRMLRELLESGGRLSEQTLLSGYNTQAVTALRIRRLVAGGHFREEAGRYRRGKYRFLFAAQVFDLLRRLLFGSTYLRIPSPPPPTEGTRSAHD